MLDDYLLAIAITKGRMAPPKVRPFYFAFFLTGKRDDAFLGALAEGLDMAPLEAEHVAWSRFSPAAHRGDDSETSALADQMSAAGCFDEAISSIGFVHQFVLAAHSLMDTMVLRARYRDHGAAMLRH